MTPIYAFFSTAIITARDAAGNLAGVHAERRGELMYGIYFGKMLPPGDESVYPAVPDFETARVLQWAYGRLAPPMSVSHAFYLRESQQWPPIAVMFPPEEVGGVKTGVGHSCAWHYTFEKPQPAGSCPKPVRARVPAAAPPSPSPQPRATSTSFACSLFTPGCRVMSISLPQGSPAFHVTAEAVGGLPNTALSAAVIARGMGTLARADYYWTRTAAVATLPLSPAPATAGTLFVPSDAAINAFLRSLGLPEGVEGLDLLSAETAGRPLATAVGAAGRAVGVDARRGPTADALLYAAVAQYGFAPGWGVDSSRFPVGQLTTALPFFPMAMIRGVSIQAPPGAGGAATAGGAFVVRGRSNNATIVSVRPYDSCTGWPPLLAGTLRPVCSNGLTPLFRPHSAAPVFAKADNVFCGGFVVHVIDSVLWPTATPMDSVVSGGAARTATHAYRRLTGITDVGKHRLF